MCGPCHLVVESGASCVSEPSRSISVWRSSETPSIRPTDLLGACGCNLRFYSRNNFGISLEREVRRLPFNSICRVRDERERPRNSIRSESSLKDKTSKNKEQMSWPERESRALLWNRDRT